MNRSFLSSLLLLCFVFMMSSCSIATKTASPANTSFPIDTPQPLVSATVTITASPTSTLPSPSATPTATITPRVEVIPVYESGTLKYFETDEHMVILTIDDGNSDQTVNNILDLLEEANVHATFFLIGIRARDSLKFETLKRMIDNGNDIGYHSNTHPSLEIVQKMEKSEWQQDYEAWTEIMKSKLGDELYAKGVSPYARVPWGEWTGTFMAFCKENGLTPVWWNIAEHSFEKGRVPPTAGGIFILHTIPEHLPIFETLFASDWKVYSLREVFPNSN